MNNRHKQIAVTAIATAAVGLLAGCASATGPHRTSRSSPISLGAIYPLSGPQGGGGLSEERGAALAADYVNDHGGVNGRPIRLDVVDVPTAESVPTAMATLQGRHIQIVVGTHGSTMSAVAATQAKQRHMLVWETGAVGNLQTGPTSTSTTTPGNGYPDGDTYGSDNDWSTGNTGAAPVAGMGSSFFRMSPQGANLGRAGIDFVLRQLAPHLPDHPSLRVAVAYVQDSYGEAVAQGVIDQVHTNHVPLAGVFPYPEYGADFTRLADQIKRSRANVLYASSYLADGEALRRATIAEQVPLVASVGTSSSYCLPAFGDQLQSAAVGLFASDKPAGYAINPAGLLPEGRATLAWAQAEWAQRYGGQMDAYATSGFANAYALFAHVLPGAKAVNPKDVIAAAVRVKLPLGSLADGSGMDFPAKGVQVGENQADASVVWEWVAPGKEVVVWPPAFATQPVQVLPIQT
jgi:branched-chain amino acid transport system substrate-binding protein